MKNLSEMKYLQVLVIFCISVFYAHSQPLQKYQGKLQNGFTDAGDVTYTYRPDEKTKDHIRQGSFRYTAKARNDQWRFNHSITGSYSSNLKDGLWTYKINQKDFQLQKPRLYTTGAITLEATYSKGMPDGRWRFESSLKSRAGEKKDDKWVWNRHDSLETVIVEMNFKSGLISGPFYAKNDKLWEVSGTFDKNGFFDGEWMWRFPDSSIVITWNEGLEVKMLTTDRDGNILHLEQNDHVVGVIKDYQNLSREGSTSVKDFPFSIDIVSLLRNPDYILTALLMATVYHQHYTLPQQITGDKAVFYDQQSYTIRFNIKGMNKIVTKNRISSTQVQHYSRMDAILTRMEAQMAYIYQMKRDDKLNKQAGDAIKLMEYNIALARRYSCTGETMKLFMDLQEGISKAGISCAYLSVSMDSFPDFKTKEEALQFFVTKISDLEKSNQTHYTNIRKNMVNKQ